MIQLSEKTPTPDTVAELKNYIRRLNSKAGQMKMDLHDIAEGLPTDYDKLLEQASKTYEIFRELDQLNQKLKEWENQLK